MKVLFCAFGDGILTAQTQSSVGTQARGQAQSEESKFV